MTSPPALLTPEDIYEEFCFVAGLGFWVENGFVLNSLAPYESRRNRRIRILKKYIELNQNNPEKHRFVIYAEEILDSVINKKPYPTPLQMMEAELI